VCSSAGVRRAVCLGKCVCSVCVVGVCGGGVAGVQWCCQQCACAVGRQVCCVWQGVQAGQEGQGGVVVCSVWWVCVCGSVRVVCRVCVCSVCVVARCGGVCGACVVCNQVNPKGSRWGGRQGVWSPKCVVWGVGAGHVVCVWVVCRWECGVGEACVLNQSQNCMALCCGS